MHVGTTLLGVHAFLRGVDYMEFHHTSASAQALPQSGYGTILHPRETDTPEKLTLTTPDLSASLESCHMRQLH